MSKRGRFSDSDRLFISQQAGRMDVDDIAEAISRDPRSIRKFIKNVLGLKPLEKQIQLIKPVPDAPKVVQRAEPAERASITYDLRNTEVWRRLSQEFEADELIYLEERYVAIVNQFESVVATEETQILQAIKFEILMSRNLQQRKKALVSIRFLENALEELIEEYCPGGDRSRITEAQTNQLLDIETKLGNARADEQSKTTEFDKLSQNHTKLMQALKATRDQRLEKIESSKVSFLDVIRQLQSKDVQELEGRQMELLRMAGENALIELGRPMAYDDGNQDNPILCADTVALDPEESK